MHNTNTVPAAARVADLASHLSARDLSLLLWAGEQLLRNDEQAKYRSAILHHMQHIPASHLDSFLWVIQQYSAVGLNRAHIASKQ